MGRTFLHRRRISPHGPHGNQPHPVLTWWISWLRSAPGVTLNPKSLVLFWSPGVSIFDMQMRPGPSTHARPDCPMAKWGPPQCIMSDGQPRPGCPGFGCPCPQYFQEACCLRGTCPHGNCRSRYDANRSGYNSTARSCPNLGDGLPAGRAARLSTESYHLYTRRRTLQRSQLLESTTTSTSCKQ